jgi:DNA-binding IclR family transcriptional regulator
MADDSPNVPVNATVTTLRIVEYVNEHGDAGVSEIAKALGMSKSTVHNHLQTLRRREYVEKDGDDYRLGLRFLDFAGGIQQRNPAFRSIREKLRQLAQKTEEICLFVKGDEETSVILFMEKGANAAETNMRFGKRIPSDSILAGQVLATVNQSELSGELGATNCRVGDEDFVQGLRSVAAPLTDRDGTLHGVMSVTGPAHRFKDDEYEEKLIDHLLNTINELELDVSYSRY